MVNWFQIGNSYIKKKKTVTSIFEKIINWQI